ncbi:MAG: DUF3616 domain-containing protein [Deltaproteobacteria bacterium]|nr:DUF3616 domain-containing protein [Deltaproteobacteria bacterium]
MKRVRSGFRRLYLAWFVVLAVVIALTAFLRQDAFQFFGIAETREIVINSESSVELAAISVTEGQVVNKDAPLVELHSPELTIQISHLSHQLRELVAKKGVDRTALQSQINQLKAQRSARVAEINFRLRELENQYRINKALTAELKSVKTTREAQSPLALRIESLRQERQLAASPFSIRIQLLEKQLNDAGAPIKIQVERLKQELALLEAKRDRLKITSPIDGVIGSINYKAGAKIAPFSPILTLHSRRPSLVKGYVHENLHSRISIGMKVKVASVATPERPVDGEVVGVGARIVAYPVRLQKRPDMPVWGRELVIRIPPNNPFLLGERTLIAIPDTRGLRGRLWAAPLPNAPPGAAKRPSTSTAADPRPIVPLQTGAIEASAALYLPQLGGALIASDDTPNNRPLLMLVDRQGKVRAELAISGAKKIDDMEALTVDNRGRIYLASSQSFNKRGKQKKRRRRLWRLSRQGTHLAFESGVDLYHQLERLAAIGDKRPWAAFLRRGVAERSINIEGISWSGGALYLGFKRPQIAGKAVVLRLADADKLMSGADLSAEQVQLAHQLDLQGEELSDLLVEDQRLFVTSTRGGAGGSVWRIESATVKRLRRYDGPRPEGLSRLNDKTLLVVFDQGAEAPSLISEVAAK